MITIHHELDIRHIPPDATDADLAMFRAEAISIVAARVDEHIQHHKRERAQRRKSEE